MQPNLLVHLFCKAWSCVLIKTLTNSSMYIFIALFIIYFYFAESTMVSSKKTEQRFACLFSINPSQQKPELTCKKDEGIELQEISVGQSTNFNCQFDSCPLEPISNRNNPYYKHLTSICHHYSKCTLSASTLQNMSNKGIFPELLKNTKEL